MDKLMGYVVKKGLIAFILLTSLVMSNMAYAAWSGFSNIMRVQVQEGVVWVQLNESRVTNVSGCTSFSGWHVFVNESIKSKRKNYKEFLAMVTTAWVLKQEVSIFTDSCVFGFPDGSGIEFAP